MTDIPKLKQKFRKYLSHQRQQLSLADRTSFSKQIISHLQHFLAVNFTEDEPLQLLVYYALAVEVDTSTLVHDERYQVFVPRMLDDMGMEWLGVDKNTVWKHQAFGVQEPEMGEPWRANALKTILIAPLLGFDRQGNRLGMGKGYFDRWIAKHEKTLDLQLGLAFSCQELPKVPVEQHDAPLAAIITEHGVLSCPTN